MKSGCELNRFWYEKTGLYDKLYYQVETVLVVAQEEIRKMTLPTYRHTTKPDMEIRWQR